MSNAQSERIVNKKSEAIFKLIASCFGIGLLKGGGTYTALVFSVIWFFVCRQNCNPFFATLVFLIITAVGILSASKVEKDWGHDSSKVVIDEAAGMCISLLFVPVRWQYVITAFILFRCLDIVKPFYIRSMEKLPQGWGVMCDDLLAGIYANIIMQIIVFGNLF